MMYRCAIVKTSEPHPYTTQKPHNDTSKYPQNTNQVHTRYPSNTPAHSQMNKSTAENTCLFGLYGYVHRWYMVRNHSACAIEVTRRIQKAIILQHQITMSAKARHLRAPFQCDKQTVNEFPRLTIRKMQRLIVCLRRKEVTVLLHRRQEHTKQQQQQQQRRQLKKTKTIERNPHRAMSMFCWCCWPCP